MRYEPLKIEPEILKFWLGNGIYAKQKSKGKKGKPFYYLDGPPYTSGKVHVGNAWGKALRDSVMRYKRMQGFEVWDRPGFDVHGLPTALGVQKELGVQTKEELLEKIGMAAFIKKCKEISISRMNDMIYDFKRIGVWMDWDNPYITAKNEYIEGVWFGLKKAWDKKLIYEGLKVMQWCANCETALAKHELEYHNDEEESIFVKFPIENKKDEYLIIWSTTPWTIPFNLAVMANPELDYAKIKVGNERWIMAKGLVNIFLGMLNKKYEILEVFKGNKLEGIKYTQPFLKDVPSLQEINNKYSWAFKVLLSTEYVDASAGSGLVHCAPGCGPEDQEVGAKYGLPPYNELDETGTFSDTMGKFAGLIAKKDDKKFINALEKTGLLITTTKVEHEYAHCQRCHESVVFRTTKQWFIALEKLKGKLISVNKKINWVPSWGGSRWFNSWLESLQDSTISRQRFWGTPLPIWVCKDCKDVTVIGSRKELEKLAGKVPTDLHKPWIDKVTIKCKCGGIKKRVEDILDVWLDAAAASWTCLDYPHRTNLLKKYWPADFILEGYDQIRGWFNVLLSFGWIVFDKLSYKAVYMHGFINDSQGRKMSKSLGNYILPSEVIDKWGADTMRFYMIGSAKPGIDMKYNFKDIEMKSRYLGILWNTAEYLLKYSKFLNINPSKLKIKDLDIEEKYILSKLHHTIAKVTELFDKYYLNEVPEEIESLFLDLSRWYVKVVRNKISTNPKSILFMIYEVMFNCLKLFAPIAPFITEQIYQNFRKEFGLKEESVHLLAWPQADRKYMNKNLEKEIEAVKKMSSLLLSIREKINRNVRWPIKSATVITLDTDAKRAVKRHASLIAGLTNVWEINIREKIEGIKYKVRVDYGKIGSKFQKESAEIIRRISEMSPESIINKLQKNKKVTLTMDSGKKANITEDDLIIEEILPKNLKGISGLNYTMYVNTEETEEMLASGFVREIIRKVQALRKQAKLNKPDKIILLISAGSRITKMIQNTRKEFKEKVGAGIIKVGSEYEIKKKNWQDVFKIKDEPIEIGFD